MFSRLIQKQQQESPPAAHYDDASSLLLGALIALASVAAASTFSIDLQSLYATMLGALTLYLATSHSEQPAHALGTLPSRYTDHGAGNDDVYYETQHSALTDDSAASSSALVIGKHTPDLLTLEPNKTVHRICFASGAGIVAALMFLLFGGRIVQSVQPVAAEIKTALLMGAVVALALIINQLRQPLRRVVFDRKSGVFWIEHTLLFNIKVRESAQMPLYQVVAVQQVAHPVSQPFASALMCRSQSGTTQELNVVFRNAERVNVVCFEDCHALRNDAAVLSNFLQVPLWASAANQPAPN